MQEFALFVQNIIKSYQKPLKNPLKNSCYARNLELAQCFTPSYTEFPLFVRFLWHKLKKSSINSTLSTGAALRPRNPALIQHKSSMKPRHKIELFFNCLAPSLGI